MNAPIASLLDNDLYKFTMQQVALNRFPSAIVEYKFRCRSKGVDLRPCAQAIRDGVSALCALSFSARELDYLRSLRFIKGGFVDFLETFRLSERFVKVEEDEREQGGLSITVKGPWFLTIPFEVPILSIVNEAYFAALPQDGLLEEGERRLAAKIELLREDPRAESIKISDFGTRRRFSGAWQERVVARLAEALPGKFMGTSNVRLAMEGGLLPIGTMAHEYLQACQVLGGDLAGFQRFALQAWAEEYRGDLGIALTDVVGADAFLRDFDLYFCKLFDGVRHDSGDPFEWGEKMIRHYRANRIDPKAKTFVFSDGLDVPKAIDLHERFSDRTQPVFGIGTNFTNDLGPKALQIVMKMVRCNGRPVAKISDSPGKAMCEDADYVAYLAKVHGIDPSRLGS